MAQPAEALREADRSLEGRLGPRKADNVVPFSPTSTPGLPPDTALHSHPEIDIHRILLIIPDGKRVASSVEVVRNNSTDYVLLLLTAKVAYDSEHPRSVYNADFLAVVAPDYIEIPKKADPQYVPPNAFLRELAARYL